MWLFHEAGYAPDSARFVVREMGPPHWRRAGSLSITMDASWDRVAPDFEPDGSLRDIYVQSATLADWDLTLQVILRDYAPATFTRDGELAAVPVSANDVFAERDSAALTLKFDVAGIELACHFFSPEEIEFDLLPKQVNSHERFAALQGFLRSLATTLGKTVILTPQSMAHLPILSVDSDGLVAYHPPTDAGAS